MAEQDSVVTAASQIHMKIKINVTWNAVAIVVSADIKRTHSFPINYIRLKCSLEP